MLRALPSPSCIGSRPQAGPGSLSHASPNPVYKIVRLKRGTGRVDCEEGREYLVLCAAHDKSLEVVRRAQHHCIVCGKCIEINCQ